MSWDMRIYNAKVTKHYTRIGGRQRAIKPHVHGIKGLVFSMPCAD